MVTVLSLLSIGLATGFLSSYLGIGGGIIAVPLLYWLFPELPVQVVSASVIGMILINSFQNIRSFKRHQIEASYKDLIPYFIVLLMGSVAGSLVSPYLNARTIKIIFATMVLLVALKLFTDKKQLPTLTGWKTPDLKFNKVGVISTFAIITAGMINPLTGLGGGVIYTPLFLQGWRLPITHLPLYNNIFMGVGAFFTITTQLINPLQEPLSEKLLWITKFQIGYVNLAITLLMALGATATIKLGPLLIKKVPQKFTRWFMIALLFLVALKVLLSALFI